MNTYQFGIPLLFVLILLAAVLVACDPEEIPSYAPPHGLSLSSGEFDDQIFGIDAYRYDTSQPGAFLLPLGVSIDPTTGALYIVDRYKNRIQRFEYPLSYLKDDNSELDYETHCEVDYFDRANNTQATVGDGPSSFISPQLVTADPVTGDIYTYEGYYIANSAYQNNSTTIYRYRISKFNSAGTYEWARTPFEELDGSPYFTIDSGGTGEIEPQLTTPESSNVAYFLGHNVRISAYNGYIFLAGSYSRNFSMVSDRPYEDIKTRMFIRVYDQGGNRVDQQELTLNGSNQLINAASTVVQEQYILQGTGMHHHWVDSAGNEYTWDNTNNVVDETGTAYTADSLGFVEDADGNMLSVFSTLTTIFDTELESYQLFFIWEPDTHSCILMDAYGLLERYTFEDATLYNTIRSELEAGDLTTLGDLSGALDHYELWVVDDSGAVYTPDGIRVDQDRMYAGDTRLAHLSAIRVTPNHVYVVNSYPADGSDETIEEGTFQSEILRFTHSAGMISYKDRFALPDVDTTTTNDDNFSDMNSLFIYEVGDAFEVYGARSVQNYVFIGAYQSSTISEQYTVGKFGEDLGEFDMCAYLDGVVDTNGDVHLVVSDGHNNRLHYLTIPRTEIPGLDL
jgi:hypothetical protein